MQDDTNPILHKRIVECPYCHRAFDSSEETNGVNFDASGTIEQLYETQHFLLPI